MEIHTETGHNALVAHLVAKYPRSRLYDRMYGASYEHYRNGRFGMVPYEQFGSRTMIFWKGRIPFLFSNAIESKAATAKSGSQGNNEDVAKIYSTITFFRGSLDVEHLLKEACDSSNNLSWSVASAQEQSRNRFVIHFVPNRKDEDGGHNYGSNGLAWYQQGYYRLLSHKPDELGKAPLHNGSALSNLIFPQRVKDLIKEIELWRNNSDWYRQKGIPWKRGWLLYGPPGTGKTALARAFAEDLNMPIYVYNLAEMNNYDLMKAWSEMQVNVPCIALIEDIDNVFHGRENVARRGSMFPMMMPRHHDKEGEEKDHKNPNPFAPLTFDCLLNCLDGVERADGVFTIVSTNDLSKIDPALGLPRKLPDGETEFISTRPGRIDKAVELTYMEAADKKLMARRILAEYPEAYESMLEFIDKFPTMLETPAQFQERCGQIAQRILERERTSRTAKSAMRKAKLLWKFCRAENAKRGNGGPGFFDGGDAIGGA